MAESKNNRGGSGSKKKSASESKKSTSSKTANRDTIVGGDFGGGNRNSGNGGKGRKSKKQHWGIRIAIVLIVGVLLGVSLLFENQINLALGLEKINEAEYDGTSAGEIRTESVGDDLNVHFVDVGQGDACIVEFPDDKKMIIDGGDKDAKDALLNYIDENIRDKDGNKITYFDYAILTHTDSDHCGSLDDVLNTYPAKTFYRPNVKCNYKDYIDPDADLLTSDCVSKATAAYKDVISASEKGREKFGDEYTVYINSYELDPIVPDSSVATEGEDGYYTLSFYGPNSNSYKDWNNYSPIMILEYEGIKIALSGDCEKEGEAEFAEKAKEGEGKFSVFTDTYAVDAIKAGHHGSRTSTGEAYVEAITTEESRPNTLIIVSCGLNNSYGHPHEEKLTQFKNEGFKDENILRTDQNGSIVLSVRYNSETSEFSLFYGADPIVKTQEKSVDWRYIALCIFAIVVIILIVIPAVKAIRKKAKKILK